MRNNKVIVGIIAVSDVVVSVLHDLEDINRKKELLVNNDSFTEDQKVSALRSYNNRIVDLEHDLSII